MELLREWYDTYHTSNAATSFGNQSHSGPTSSNGRLRAATANFADGGHSQRSAAARLRRNPTRVLSSSDAVVLPQSLSTAQLKHTLARTKSLQSLMSRRDSSLSTEAITAAHKEGFDSAGTLSKKNRFPPACRGSHISAMRVADEVERARRRKAEEDAWLDAQLESRRQREARFAGNTSGKRSASASSATRGAAHASPEWIPGRLVVGPESVTCLPLDVVAASTTENADID